MKTTSAEHGQNILWFNWCKNKSFWQRFTCKIKWEANWSKVPHLYFRRFLEFSQALTHLVPGHLVPGHLVPGLMVWYIDKLYAISSKNLSREWCYKILCYNRRGPCLRVFRRSNCYWVVYQLWTDFVSTQKIFYLRSPLHCTALGACAPHRACTAQ